MFAGKEHAEAGLAAVRDGDLDTATEAFATADAAFDRASGNLSSPFVRLAALVPGAAQNLGAARDLADVGQELSNSAIAVSERARAEDLQVVDGHFPVAAAADVGARLTDAHDALAASSDRLSDMASPWLVGEVADAVDSVSEAVSDTESSVAVVAEATRLAPQLLGTDGDRRWFIAAISPSELRGAGGILGDVALVRASDGTLEFEHTTPASELNAATDEQAMAYAVPPVYRELYGGWQAHRFWQNLTAPLDFPTVGLAIRNGYTLVGDGEVQGVIGIDPIGVAGLLEVTGPIRVETWPEPITAENAVQVLLFDNYDRLPPDEIDEFQGDVLEALVDALTDRNLPSISQMATALAPAVSGGHLRFWSGDVEEQALFRMAGADGAAIPAALEDTDDHLTVITQNSSEAKIDWYLRRSVTYDVAYDPALGLASTVATVTLTNGAPASGAAEYVIGGAPGGPTGPGENRISLTLRTALPVVEATDGGGNPVGVATVRDGDLHNTTLRTVIPPGGSATFVLRFRGRRRLARRLPTRRRPPADGVARRRHGHLRRGEHHLRVHRAGRARIRSPSRRRGPGPLGPTARRVGPRREAGGAVGWRAEPEADGDGAGRRRRQPPPHRRAAGLEVEAGLAQDLERLGSGDPLDAGVTVAVQQDDRPQPGPGRGPAPEQVERHRPPEVHVGRRSETQQLPGQRSGGAGPRDTARSTRCRRSAPVRRSAGPSPPPRAPR